MKEKKKPIVEEAIPAAIRVKDKILDIRDNIADQIGTITFREHSGRKFKKEISEFRGSLAVLYQHLKMKFPKNHKIHGFDKALRERKDLTFAELYDYWDMMVEKIEKLKITKIERKRVPDETSWG
jgi:hypothetical protein